MCCYKSAQIGARFDLFESICARKGSAIAEKVSRSKVEETPGTVDEVTAVQIKQVKDSHK